MANRVYRINLFTAATYAAMEEYLAQQAEKGLLLEKCGGVLLRFQKGESTPLRYAVLQIAAEGSVQHCKENMQAWGWTLAAEGWGDVLVFCRPAHQTAGEEECALLPLWQKQSYKATSPFWALGLALLTLFSFMLSVETDGLYTSLFLGAGTLRLAVVLGSLCTFCVQLYCQLRKKNPKKTPPTLQQVRRRFWLQKILAVAALALIFAWVGVDRAHHDQPLMETPGWQAHSIDLLQFENRAQFRYVGGFAYTSMQGFYYADAKTVNTVTRSHRLLVPTYVTVRQEVGDPAEVSQMNETGVSLDTRHAFLLSAALARPLAREWQTHLFVTAQPQQDARFDFLATGQDGNNTYLVAQRGRQVFTVLYRKQNEEAVPLAALVDEAARILENV